MHRDFFCERSSRPATCGQKFRIMEPSSGAGVLEHRMNAGGVFMSKAIGAGLALAVLLFAPAAQAQVKAGVLSCDVSGGFGWVLGSSKSVSCIFTPDQPGPIEGYVGVINKFGLDLGVTTRQSMVWGVFAPSDGPWRGALAGSYVGATGEATFAVGLGANVLVGGSNRSIALQPVSVTGQTGINIAAGVADLQLRPAGPPPRR